MGVLIRVVRRHEAEATHAEHWSRWQVGCSVRCTLAGLCDVPRLMTYVHMRHKQAALLCAIQQCLQKEEVLCAQTMPWLASNRAHRSFFSTALHSSRN